MSNSSKLLIREARLEDLPAIQSIYEPYVLETTVSFEYESPSLDDFANRLQTIQAEYPFLVAQLEDTVVGYAYGHRYQERKAFDYTCEISIYLASSSQGYGIGHSLYQELEKQLKKAGFILLVAAITADNDSSLSFHQRNGFTLAGRLNKVGYKFGRWLDLILMTKEIN
ncbi:GNAT family N-acetyltransferase [Hutsoniella sourekii]|uniref:GNAT family N-acetyltransferase n=1 Tax=Hutsoniella sourekii TaxID=87650 RepID=UPI000487859F|nr:GNAT family N-acetyltransferase [Hutsoniella sourekii]